MMKISKLYFLIGISIVFFFVKGIQYAIIGSYIPLLLVLIILCGLLWSFFKNKNAHRKILNTWGVLIIIWAVARFGVWIMFEIDQSLSETHVREQFGILQHLISIIMLIIGVTILRIKKSAGNNVYN